MSSFEDLWSAAGGGEYSVQVVIDLNATGSLANASKYALYAGGEFLLIRSALWLTTRRTDIS